MMDRNKILLIVSLVVVCALPVCTSAGLPMVQFPLKASPAQGPYQDDAFFAKGDKLITSLSNTSVPSGTALLDLISTQQTISRMSISPALHAKAQNVNDFLFYTGKAGTYYSDASSLTHSPYSPISQGEAGLDDANIYYSAAKQVWERIKDDYPGVTLYTLGASSNPDTQTTLETETPSARDLYSGQSILGEGVSKTGHSGLW
jgi:hypothetical protein